MIKFFRQIRYKLMSENKTSKYFKYAIGEIILVVIGILIALQINNWNEAKKTKQKEELALLEILSDLEYSIKDLERTNYLKELGISEIRFTNSQILNEYETVIKNINTYLSEDIPLGVEGFPLQGVRGQRKGKNTNP